MTGSVTPAGPARRCGCERQGGIRARASLRRGGVPDGVERDTTGIRVGLHRGPSGSRAISGAVGPESVGGGTVRILLIVDDPESVVERAKAAGATELHPVSEE
jgi:hypothetical protein